jgi:alkylated DNA repair dioxygenase AlkB
MDLFTPIDEDRVIQVPGLELYLDVITPEQERKLIDWIDAQAWLDDFSRRVQHYGYRYDYRARSIDVSSKLGDLPLMLQRLATHLRYNKSAIHFTPEQVIVNEYEPGQGISAHVDCEPCFGADIASLSLGSTAVMKFTCLATREVVDVPLPRRSIVVLSGDSRTTWSHAIPARKSDVIAGAKKLRTRRVSVTLRTVILG